MSARKKTAAPMPGSNPHSWLKMDNTLDRFAFGVLERSYQGRTNSAEEWITTKAIPVPPKPGGPLLTAERVDVALPRHADDGWRNPLVLARDVDAAAKLTSKPTLLAYATLFFPQVLQAHQAFREAWLVADQIAAEHNLPVVVVQHVPSRAGSNNPIHCHLNIVPRYVQAGTAGLGGYDPTFCGMRGAKVLHQIWMKVRA